MCSDDMYFIFYFVLNTKKKCVYFFFLSSQNKMKIESAKEHSSSTMNFNYIHSKQKKCFEIFPQKKMSSNDTNPQVRFDNGKEEKNDGNDDENANENKPKQPDEPGTPSSPLARSASKYSLMRPTGLQRKQSISQSQIHSSTTHEADNNNNNNNNTGNKKGKKIETKILSQRDNIRIAREEFDDAFKWITAKCHNGRVTERHLKEQIYSVFGQSQKTPKWTRKEFAVLASDPDLTADKLWAMLPSQNSCDAFDTVAEAFASGFDEDLDGYVDTHMMRKMWKKLCEEHPNPGTGASALKALAAKVGGGGGVTSRNSAAGGGASSTTAGTANSSKPTVASTSSSAGATAGNLDSGINVDGTTTTTASVEPVTGEQPQQQKDPFADVLKMYLQIADSDGDGLVNLNDFREYSRKKKPIL
jgi:Ca2+-binding EF-hand superfamily protein